MRKKSIVVSVIGGFVLLMTLYVGMLYLDIEYNALERIQTELFGCRRFSWEDVEAFIDENAEKASSICLKCGRRKTIIFFRSPDWTWRELCGRMGYLTICEHCKRQYEFDCIGMN